MTETNSCCEVDLAKLCREALEKSFGMDIPMPKCIAKKDLVSYPDTNSFRIEEYWSKV